MQCNKKQLKWWVMKIPEKLRELVNTECLITNKCALSWRVRVVHLAVLVCLARATTGR